MRSPRWNHEHARLRVAMHSRLSRCRNLLFKSPNSQAQTSMRSGRHPQGERHDGRYAARPAPRRSRQGLMHPRVRTC